MSSREPLTLDRPRQAVILAGGRGTRLMPLTETRPKAMIEFHGKPFLEYLLEMLREQGFERILLLLGYLPEVIQDHFGTGSRIGLDIEYSVTEPDDLTVHRVRQVADELDDLFLLLYCDNYWPLQMDRHWARYQELGTPGMVTVYNNKDAYTRNSVEVDERGFVVNFDRSRTSPNLQGVEISYAILPKTVVDLFPEGDELFEQAVYPQLAARGQLGALTSDHRYYSVGSHERLPLTDAFLARSPAVILDRDGVLNEKPPRAHYVTSPEEFRWLPGAREALRLFKDNGYRVMVVSNQAGIARGAMSEADLEQIHEKMIADTEEFGGAIEAIYHCPHDWDEGCECRKPNPGMLFKAQRDHHLDLSRTYFLGDDERDGQAASAAGSRWAMVDDDSPLLKLTELLIDGRLES